MLSDNNFQVSQVIAVGEHAWTRELRAPLVEFGGDDTVTWLSNPDITSHRLLDVGDERLAGMDAAGADLQLLSITTPATQPLPAALAVPLARDANESAVGIHAFCRRAAAPTWALSDLLWSPIVPYLAYSSDIRHAVSTLSRSNAPRGLGVSSRWLRAVCGRLGVDVLERGG